MSVTASYVNGNNNAANTTVQYRKGSNFCMLCDYRCIQCTGPINLQCSTCRDQFYKWVTHTNCLPYCPTVAITDAVSTWSWTTNTRGQWIDSVSTCAYCDPMCNFCNGAAATDCFACTAGYKLIDDQAECISRFSTVGYGP